MSVTEAAVIEALRPVQDPELHRSIVDLGMVRSTTIDGGHVEVGIDLTIAGCPLRNQIQSEVTEAVTALDGVNLVSIDFGVMTDEQRAKVREMLHGNPAATAGSQAAHGHAEGRAIPFAEAGNRTRVLLIASGKGGVGKSSVTANLAIALAQQGKSVAVVDADVWGFSIPRMLGVELPPTVIDDMIVPPSTHGVRCISMGFFAQEDQPVIWRGPMLHKALEIWTAEHRRGIWLKLSTAQSHLIASATRQGFDFQHAEPGYCVLTKWLPKETMSRLPNGPTHQVGIGALVIHPLTGKMLAVQERTGPAAKRKLWKMPTGLTDPGEDIAVAAVRELKEETGLDCVFDKIICFRQAHGGLFGRSDMFFVCLCRLAPEAEERVRNGGEVELLPQEEEILQADWIDMEDYATQGVWRESPLYRTMNGAMLKAAKKGISYSSLNGDEGGDGDNESHGFVAKNLPVGFRPGSNTIYVSSKL